MAEAENYLTKKNPTDEDWLDYNQPVFARLKGDMSIKSANFAPLTDADLHAEAAGLNIEEYLEQLRDRVGPLGDAVLRIVNSEMDKSQHIVLGAKE